MALISLAANQKDILGKGTHCFKTQSQIIDILLIKGLFREAD